MCACTQSIQAIYPARALSSVPLAPRGCDTRLSSFAACTLLRPSVRLFLLARAVIRRSTLAVAVATVARSSRVVAARLRRRPGRPSRPPSPGSPLPLGREGGEGGRPPPPLSPSECPQADFAIGEQRDRPTDRPSEADVHQRWLPHPLIVWPNDLFPPEGCLPREGGKEGGTTLPPQKC